MAKPREPHEERPAQGTVSRQGDSGKLANLVRYPAGSNGGTRRGPDRFPRRNAIRALFLNAMAQDQERERIDPSTGKVMTDEQGRPVKTTVKFAMVEDMIKAYQLIARHAAEGKDLDTFLRMMRDAHRMLQPAKDEAGEGRAPVHAQFVFAPSEPEVPPQGETAAAPAPAAPSRARAAGAQPKPTQAEGGAIIIGGQVYE